MKNFTNRKEHLRFLGKPLPGLHEIECFLPEEHIFLLERYGAWMAALLNKEIKPLTEAQKSFIQAVNGNRSAKNSFRGTTEDEHYVILDYAPTSFKGNSIKRYSAKNDYPNLRINEIEKLNQFKKAWIKSKDVRNRIQDQLIKQERQLTNSVTAELNKRERQLSNRIGVNPVITRNRDMAEFYKRERQPNNRVTNVGSCSNYDTKYNESSNSGGGFGFITGIILAVLAFSIVPVIPVIIAFFAGHWMNYNLGKD